MAFNSRKLQKFLAKNGSYDDKYKGKIKELAKEEKMKDHLKEISKLFGYQAGYICSSFFKYLKKDDYSIDELIRIIGDKLYLINHMTRIRDSYNGPDLEKLYERYEPEAYGLFLQRFIKHYTRGETAEYSALQYTNVLLGENNQKLKYITICLMPNEVEKLLELRPDKLEAYLDNISIGHCNSNKLIIKFSEMVASLEQLNDNDFRNALGFVYYDNDDDSIEIRLNFLPFFMMDNKQDERGMTFNCHQAQVISQLPKSILIELNRNLVEEKENVESILHSITKLIVRSICGTSPIQQDIICDMIHNPTFFNKTDEEKYLILESLRKNGNELEEDRERYFRKSQYILSNEDDILLKMPFLKYTLNFICQKDSEEVFAVKKEALENYNGSFEDENQYRKYLELLQKDLSNQSEYEKIGIISSISQYLTKEPFANFYQRIENSYNKDRFMELFDENTSKERFFSIGDIIASEKMWDKDVYTKILDYIYYTKSNEELEFALNMMQQTISKGSSREGQTQMAANLSDSLTQTFSTGDYRVEIIGDGLLQKQLREGELVYTSPNCKAQIKIKKI